MRYLTSDQFKAVLLTGPVDQVISQRLLAGIPYVLRNSPDAYSQLRASLAHALNVRAEDVKITGSAHLGFSIAPSKYGRRFGEQSDVDVIIVSRQLFDSAWQDLLRWHFSRNWSLPHSRRERIIEHHRKSIYWGHMWPDMLLHVSGLARTWTSAFRSLTRIREISFWEVKGRLYRTWEHVALYQANSLAQVAARLAHD